MPNRLILSALWLVLLSGGAYAQTPAGPLSAPFTAGPHSDREGDLSARHLYGDAGGATVGGTPLSVTLAQGLSANDTVARNAAASAAAAAAAANSLAAAALPANKLGTAGGAAQLDGNSLVPTGQINPASIATDQTARNAASSAAAAAGAAQTTASAALPANKVGIAGGAAQLDGNAQIPMGEINPTSAATDQTARNAASSAQGAANAAQATANAALPASAGGAKNGYAQLDGNAQIPTALINPASVATDQTARNAANTAAAVANSAQTAANAALPASQLGASNGAAQLDKNGQVPTGQINPASAATDQTARNAASNAQSAASAAQATASAAVPSNTAGAKNGYAQLDGSALVPTAEINPASAATDATARNAASSAASAASAAQATANAAVPASSANAKNGYAQLDASALIPNALLRVATSGSPGIASFDPNFFAVNSNGFVTFTGQATTAIDNASIIRNAAGALTLGDLSNASVTVAGGIARSAAAQRGDVMYLADYGVKGDLQTIGSVTFSSGGKTVSSSTYTFGPGDVGKVEYGAYEAAPPSGKTHRTIVSVANGVATMSDAWNTNSASTTVFTISTPDDTPMANALQQYSAYQVKPRIVAPPGTMTFLQSIAYTASNASTNGITLQGAGIGMSIFEFMENTDGIVITDCGGDANLSDFMVSKRVGANAGTMFVGRGIYTGCSSGLSGHIQEKNIQVADNYNNAEGWLDSVVIENGHNYELSHLIISGIGAAQGVPAAGDLVYPGSSNQTWQNTTAPGYGTGFLIFGSNGNFVVDGNIQDSVCFNRVSCVDTWNYQGDHIEGGHFVNVDWGVRELLQSGYSSNFDESLDVNDTIVQAYDGDIVESYGAGQIIGNQLWGYQSTGTGHGSLNWFGLWASNPSTQGLTVEGNMIFDSATSGWGVYYAGQGFANTINGNLFYGENIGVALDPVAQNATVGMNAFSNVGTTVSNPNPGANFVWSGKMNEDATGVFTGGTISQGTPGHYNFQVGTDGSVQSVANVRSAAALVSGDGTNHPTYRQPIIATSIANGATVLLTPYGSVPAALPSSGTSSAAYASGSTSIVLSATPANEPLAGELVYDGSTLIGTLTTTPTAATLAVTASLAPVASGDTISFRFPAAWEIGNGKINADFGSLDVADLTCRDTDASATAVQFTANVFGNFLYYHVPSDNAAVVFEPAVTNVTTSLFRASFSTTLTAAATNPGGHAVLLPLADLPPQLPAMSAIADTTSGHTGYLQAAMVEGMNGLTATAYSSSVANLPASGDGVTITGGYAMPGGNGTAFTVGRYPPDGSPLLSFTNGTGHTLTCGGHATFLASP